MTHDRRSFIPLPVSGKRKQIYIAIFIVCPLQLIIQSDYTKRHPQTVANLAKLGSSVNMRGDMNIASVLIDMSSCSRDDGVHR